MTRRAVAVVLAALAGVGCEKQQSKPATDPAPPPTVPVDAARAGASGAADRPGTVMSEDVLILPGIGDGPARVQTQEEAIAYGDPECPRYVGARTTAAKKIGKHGRTLDVEGGYVWQIKDGKLQVFDGKVTHPIRILQPDRIPKGVIALDATHWFVKRCQDGGCGPHGTGIVIDRVAIGTQDRDKAFVGPQSEIIRAQVYGDDLYWITLGLYGETGELRRVPTKGGDVETLWTGRGMTVMRIDDRDVFASDGSSVVAVPRAGGKPRILAEGLQDVRDLAVDAKTVYIAESGDPFGNSEPSGYIKSVPRRGGSVTILAGPQKWPTVVAVDDERVYYMLREPGDIWAITKGTGGPPTMLVPTPPRDSSCLSSKWLHVDALGLKWVRMVEGFHSGTLWSLSRHFLPSPPDTPVEAFKRAMAAVDAGAAPVDDDASGDAE
jgi:hypothetical protein